MIITQRTLTRKEKILWVQLLRSRYIGPKNFFDLLAMCHGDIEKTISELDILAKRGGVRKSFHLFPFDAAEREIEDTERFGAHLICYPELSYPDDLRHIPDPPPIITVKGNLSLLQRPIFGIVGSRRCSLNGQKMARRITEKMCMADWVIVSGLARGIDRVAHDVALHHGTIAVIAGGIDSIYPQEHKQLMMDIMEHGLVVTERPFGSVPAQRFFPKRNRIIAGLSRGILIVEGHMSSGTMITANYAADQGRELFAVPGFPLDPYYQGTNKLIRDGAILTRDAEDILEVMEPLLTQKDFFKKRHTPPYQYRLEDGPPSHGMLLEARREIPLLIGASPITIDDIIHETSYSINVVLTVIIELELAGRLERLHGGRVAMIMEA